MDGMLIDEFPSPTQSEAEEWLSLEIETHTPPTSTEESLSEYREDAVPGASIASDVSRSAYKERTNKTLALQANESDDCEDEAFAGTIEENLIQTEVPHIISAVQFELQIEIQWRLQQDLITPERLVKDISIRTRPFTQQEVERTLNEVLGKKLLLELEDPQSTLKAQLHWTTSRNTPFKLRVLRPVKLKTSALQRKFGCHRVFQLALPSLKDKPKDLSWEDANTAMDRLLSRPLMLLGRRWSAFDLQMNKVTKESSTRSSAFGGSILFLFAWAQRETIISAMNWAIPYEKNKHQPSRKAFSRLGLQLSRTDAIVVFDETDVEYGVKDRMSNGETEIVSYGHEKKQLQDDEQLQADAAKSFRTPRVMNDGCSTISMWVAVQYQRQMGLDTPPSALQGRIAGSKGVWFVDKEDPEGLGDKPDGIHVRISKSQIKVKRDDLSSHDASIRTFNVVRCNESPRATFLYRGFIMILVNRGVSRDHIIQIIRDQVRAATKKYLDAIRSPGTIELRKWLASEQGRFEEVHREDGISSIAGFPTSKEEAVIHMLESGFDHRSSQYLGSKIHEIGRDSFNPRGNKFKVKLPRATSLMGVADDKGILKPGEIQVHFSAIFKDAAEDSWTLLKDMDALVARNPSLAPWDIQKVRLVFYPELSHLKDVVVFSSRGERPLAEKLSGGDYDGDTFWVCWHPLLVDPFRNEVAPFDPPPPEVFGIDKDTTKLSDHVKDRKSADQWCKWIGKMTLARTNFTYLGAVTLLHERVTYADQKVDTDRALALVHLHDHLVDADKQGYHFTADSYDWFKKKFNIPRNTPQPRYWEFIKPTEVKISNEPLSSNHIIDEIYFNVIQPEVNAALREADKLLNPATEDQDLVKFYKSQNELVPPGSVMRQELDAMMDKLSNLRADWREDSRAAVNSDDPEAWERFILGLREKYDSIQLFAHTLPTSSSSSSMSWTQGWTTSQGSDLSLWDKLKASAFAFNVMKAGKKPSMLFHIAGREMCLLKAYECGEMVRPVVEGQYGLLKVRGNRKKKRRTGGGEVMEIGEDDEDEADGI